MNLIAAVDENWAIGNKNSDEQLSRCLASNSKREHIGITVSGRFCDMLNRDTIVSDSSKKAEIKS
ncbi:MAG: hypothetical protein IIV70_07355 [Peptococcaceae bacterium]|nr:hypothetical protein [Peptococcaceae bacterium]